MFNKCDDVTKRNKMQGKNYKMICIYVMDGPWKPKTNARENNTNIWIPKIPQLASNSFPPLSLSLCFLPQPTKKKSIPLSFPLPEQNLADRRLEDPISSGSGKK